MATASVTDQLTAYLRVASQRATVIASNMANVDTPGYHTRDVNFSAELSRAMNAPEGSALPEPHTVQVSGLMERPDGNNVDIDRESLGLAETQLQYQAGTQLLKSQFHQLLAAIGSGGS